MKKTLVAIAALAATGAFAQSSVTLYGAVDAAYTYATATGGKDSKGGDVASAKQKSLTNSALGSSKLGFKGTEDLGGGLTAIFKLEGGLANDSGNGKSSNANNQANGGCTVGNVTPTTQSGFLAAGTTGCTTGGSQGLDFQRYSYVGLTGAFGELHLGREYLSSFQMGQGAVDPMGTNGPAAATNMFYKLTPAYAAINTSNMISYTSPLVAGVQGGVQYFMGENKSTAANGSDGNGFSVYAKYAQGPLLVTGAVSKAQYLNEGDYTVRALAASYDFGPATATYTYAKEKQVVGRANAVEQQNHMNLFGVIVPMGAANFKATYIAADRTGALAELKGKQYAVGVDYALSKRTSLYSTYSRITNSGANGTTNYNAAGYGIDTGAIGSKSNNFALGAFHAF